jgi:hypothetical protein
VDKKDKAGFIVLSQEKPAGFVPVSKVLSIQYDIIGKKEICQAELKLSKPGKKQGIRAGGNEFNTQRLGLFAPQKI